VTAHVCHIAVTGFLQPLHETLFSEFQVRVHLAKLEALEYVDRRWGHQGRRCSYELLVDVNEPDDTWHIGLLDVAKLKQRENPGSETSGLRARESTGTPKTSCTQEATSGHFVKETSRSAKPRVAVACG